MHPNDAISPLAPGELHCPIVMDLIYRPLKTQLLKLAAKKGIATVSGVEMFLAQIGISPLAPGELHCPIVMDLIYRPLKTQLLKLAAKKGIATVSGVEMFLA